MVEKKKSGRQDSKAKLSRIMQMMKGMKKHEGEEDMEEERGDGKRCPECGKRSCECD